MGTHSRVMYNGLLYEDAEKVAKAAGKTMKQLCVGPGAKSIVDKGYRKKEFLDGIGNVGVSTDIDGYVGDQNAYSAFCNLFFLDKDKYVINLGKTVREEKPEKDKVGFMMSELRASLEELQKASRGHTMMMSTIDGNLAQLVELERENAKMLQSLVAGIGSTVSTIEKSTTENMECLHKLGPKVGEIDKKMKNIETGVGTVSRSHAGLVANVANIWGRFERWTKR